jgi:hypothetical protein
MIPRPRSLSRLWRNAVRPDCHIIKRKKTGGSRSNSRVLYEPQIEGYKNQNNADIRDQPFPESIPKKQ